MKKCNARTLESIRSPQPIAAPIDGRASSVLISEVDERDRRSGSTIDPS